MKTKQRNKASIICLAFLFAMGTFTQLVSAADTGTTEDHEDPVFSVVISNDKPKMNQEIQLTIQGKHLYDVYAYEVNLTYDNERLTLKKAVSAIPGFSVAPIVKEDQILFGHTKTGSVPGDTGDLTLCTLIFTATGKGMASIALDNVKLVNSKVDMAIHLSDAQVSFVVDKGQLALKDISGHWAESSIEQAVQRGFVSGYEDGTFRPDRHVTRAEFTAMLAQALKLPEGDVSTLPFNDFQQIPTWARPFVSMVFKHAIVSGYDDNTFRADRLITRAEMTTIIAKSSNEIINIDESPIFADANKIPAWARPYVAAAAKTGLVKGRGDNLFVPNDHATRAEAVTLILALIHKL